jgi:hypothetical protein
MLNKTDMRTMKRHADYHGDYYNTKHRYAQLTAG